MLRRAAVLLVAMATTVSWAVASPAAARVPAAPAAVAIPNVGLPTVNAPVVNRVIGTGTPESCTSSRVAAAVKKGGNISFNCGPNPVTIVLSSTLYTCNTDTCKHAWQGGRTVTAMTMDGGGLVTLKAGTTRGIFYANTCEVTLGWISDRCDLQTTPRITFKNIGFSNGNATKGPWGKASVGGGGGGGAIAMRGGTLLIQDSKFTSNRCITAHSDAGGGAVRAVGVRGKVTIERSTFTGNRCANGGAISSLGSSVLIYDSVIKGNTATGYGASSGKGGNGGGVYFDGGSQGVRIVRTAITGNKVGAGGSGVFYVSNNRAGTLTFIESTVTGNTGEKFWTGSRHDLFYLGKQLTVISSTID